MRTWFIILALLLIAGCSSANSMRQQADMPRVILFHHALGVTPGIEAFAEQLRMAGCQVTVADLYGGRVFDTITNGVAYAEELGFDVIIERGVSFAGPGPEPLIVIGFSLGVLPAQKIAQTRPGVVGAILCHSAVPVSTFGDKWPQGVALQLHLVKDDPLAEEDLQAAHELVAAAGAELFLYEGSGHLVAEPGHADFDDAVANQMLNRARAFIAAFK